VRVNDFVSALKLLQRARGRLPGATRGYVLVNGHVWWVEALWWHPLSPVRVFGLFREPRQRIEDELPAFHILGSDPSQQPLTSLPAQLFESISDSETAGAVFVADRFLEKVYASWEAPDVRDLEALRTKSYAEWRDIFPEAFRQVRLPRSARETNFAS